MKQRLIPEFGRSPLKDVTRPRIKTFLARLAQDGLSQNTLRNTLCTLRGMLNHAIEDGVIDRNPAARLGRFAKTDRPRFEATALTKEEAESFLSSAREVCPEYYALFLTALRAGLRRGELVALRLGDIQFGRTNDDPNRYIVVRHNYVNRQFTTPKSKKTRRVDLSRQLRKELQATRDGRLLVAFEQGKTNILDELVFPAPVELCS